MNSANMRNFSFTSRAWQHLLAIWLIIAITAVLVVLRDELQTTLIALLYLIPLGIITALWGLGPGITSALVTFLAFNYFFIEPFYTFTIHHPADVVILLVFLIVALVISQLLGRAQAGLAAATAREREATQLYELSTELTGSHEDHVIAQILAKQVQTVANTDFIELHIMGARTFSFQIPESDPPNRPPELIIPIETARGVHGEIRLWRATPAVSSNERMLFQTFASQSAIALDRALLAKAESRAQVLEESDRLKSAILSSVSHEFRTPLSTIKAAASSLRSKDVDWNSRARSELIAAIDEEADHLNMLIGNLLDMSRIESGVLKPNREWNILSEIVGSVLDRMRHTADEHRFEIDIPENLPLLPVDYVQMEQVFTNLVSNSLKYAPAHSVIHISAHVADNLIHIQVSNQGPKVPQEDLERIFDKFYRVTAADRVTGTGLGLSICKGIVEAHGGNIWAENLSDGLAFNFTLPPEWDGTSPPSFLMAREDE